MQFSVAMNVYGGDDAEHFRASLKSVLEQTCPPSEVVLVVDGPVDGDIAAAVADCERNGQCRVLRLDTNEGLGVARRVATEHCKYAYIAMMDADDIAEKDRFAKQIAYLEQHPETDVLGGQIEEFENSTNEVTGRRIVPEQNADIYRYLSRRCPFNHMTVMLKKSMLEKAGGYLPWHLDEDTYLWARMAIQHAVFHNLPDSLVRVRVDSATYERRGGWKYFMSLAKMQQFLWKNQLVATPRFLMNITERFILQVMLPNKLRGYIFRKFARRH